MTSAHHPPVRALFLTENVPFSLDTRLHRQTDALKQQGLITTVISPAGPGESVHDIEAGTHVYRYRKPAWGEGFLAHVAEYVTSVMAQTLLAFWCFYGMGLM